MATEKEIVSGKFIKELFSSQEFVNSALKAADVCRKEKKETGFNIIKRIGSNQAWFTDIVIGENDGMKSAKSTQTPQFNEHMVKDNKNYELVFIHFHPRRDITPSEGDLKVPLLYGIHQDVIGCRFKPILGIGVELHKRQIGVPILLYQMKKYPENFEEFVKSVYKNIERTAVEYILQDDLFSVAFGNSKKKLKRRKKITASQLVRHSEYPDIVARELRKGGYYKTAVLNIYPDSGVYEEGLKAASKLSFKVKRYKSWDDK